MCFRFGSCFGSGSGQDYGRSTSKATHHVGGGQANHDYYSGADQKSGPQAYQQQQPAAANETGANNAGGVRKDHVDDAGGHGGHAAYAQDKATDEASKYAQDKANGEASKHPAAWNGKLGHDTDYTHTYTARLHDAAADPRENIAMDRHHYTATTTTTLARY